MAASQSAHYADLVQIGPYTVLEEIARGGHGVVYRAQDSAGRVVALKLLLVQRAQNPNARKRFQAEIHALSRLRHPNVVSILGAGECEGSPWLALEFVEGESLQAQLRHGPLPIHDAIRIALQLAQALSYVHACGVLHRDLKPDNVLLRGEDALLTDFGLALDESREHTRLTATGVFQGTPGYWAPEQARGQTHAHGPVTDVYGLGAVLYACLTGQPPVRAGSLQEYLQASHFTTPSPGRLRADVPSWLCDLCLSCLAEDPAARPASPDAVARALLLATPTSAARWTHGVAALVGLLVLAALGGALWTLTPRTEPPSPPGAKPRDAPSEAQAWRERGEDALESRRFAQALERFTRALELDPDNPQAYVHRGLCKAALERHADALADFERAVELDPSGASSRLNLALCKTELGRHDEALEDYDLALELDPDNPQAYVHRGLCKELLRRYPEAIEDYDRALELDPNNAAAYHNRGDCRLQQESFTAAIEDYERAMGLNPSDGDSWAGRGLCMFRLQRYAEAVEDFDRGFALGVTDFEAELRELRAAAAQRAAAGAGAGD